MRWGISRFARAASAACAALLVAGFASAAVEPLALSDADTAHADTAPSVPIDFDALANDEAVFWHDAAVSAALRSGRASYYADKFHGRRTASGEVFLQTAMTAAHRDLPMGTMLRVTHESSGRSVIVRVNDRGPFAGNRVIDLSKAAARELGMLNAGIADVTLELLPTS